MSVENQLTSQSPKGARTEEPLSLIPGATPPGAAGAASPRWADRSPAPPEASAAEDERFMREALALAREAAAEGEVPVGAVVVCGGAIVGRGRNRREQDKTALAHAELEAIAGACRTLGGWRLWQCTLYVTLEPCPMCAGAIINARIPRLVFGASDPKAGSCGSLVDLFSLPYNHHPAVVSGVLGQEAAELLREFFRGLRSAGRRSAAQAAAGPLLSSEKKVGKDSQGAAPP